MSEESSVASPTSEESETSEEISGDQLDTENDKTCLASSISKLQKELETKKFVALQELSLTTMLFLNSGKRLQKKTRSLSSIRHKTVLLIYIASQDQIQTTR